MDRHADAFLEMLSAERGAARNTIAAYQADLDDFAGFAASRGHAVARADDGTLLAYLAHLHDQGLSARTAARRLSALRQFHRFLLRERIRDDDPTLLLDSPRLPQTLPKYLSEAEVDALLAAAAHLPLTRDARFDQTGFTEALRHLSLPAPSGAATGASP